MPPLNDPSYVEAFKARMHDRIEYINALEPQDQLPQEAVLSIINNLTK
jgi:hypothetical protein